MFFIFEEIAAQFKDPLITVGEEKAEVANTDLNSDVVCACYQGQPDDIHRFDCTQRMYGRYVRVTILGDNAVLHVREIEVIGLVSGIIGL